MTDPLETTPETTDIQVSGDKPVWRKPGIFVYEAVNAESSNGASADADGPHS